MHRHQWFKLFYDAPDTSKPGLSPVIDVSDERKAFDTELADKEDTNESDETDEGAGEGSDDEDSGDEDVTDESEGTEEESEESDAEPEEETDDEELDELKTDSVYQKIKELDPKILKKIPELRSVIFRDQKFTEMFGSVEEAQQVAERVEVFNQLEQEVYSGSSEGLIIALEKTDKKALESFVAGFLPQVRETNKELFWAAVAPTFKEVLRKAAQNPDERIATAAKNIHYFIFDDFDFNKDAGLQPKSKDNKETDLDRREKEFNSKIHQDFTRDVESSAIKRVRNDIAKTFAASGMSELSIRHITAEILGRVDAALGKDARHNANMKALWKNAERQRYSSDGKDRLINTYRSRAKALIPQFRQQVLKEMKLSVPKESEGVKKKATRVPSSGSISSGGYKGGPINPKKIDWNKTDERALLDGKVTMKS